MTNHPATCPKCGAPYKPPLKAYKCGSYYFGVDGNEKFYREWKCMISREDQLEAALEICLGSINAFLEKEDDAPMSAIAHLEEAVRIIRYVGVRGTESDRYSGAAINLRLKAL